MVQKWMLWILAAGLASGCGSGFVGYQAKYADSRPASAVERLSPQTGGEDEVITAGAFEDRQVIYTAALQMLVGDVESALQRSRQIAENLGGHMQAMAGRSIVLRVPAEKFDTAVEQFSEMGTVIDREILARDVTEKYTDLELRLENARALAERLREMLKKARDLEAALAIERQLSEVTLEIERMSGKMRRLGNQISLATITLRLQPTTEAPAEIRTRLPFAWLDDLGLDTLLDFGN
jgi:hypothetical protein